MGCCLRTTIFIFLLPSPPKLFLRITSIAVNYLDKIRKRGISNASHRKDNSTTCFTSPFRLPKKASLPSTSLLNTIPMCSPEFRLQNFKETQQYYGCISYRSRLPTPHKAYYLHLRFRRSPCHSISKSVTYHLTRPVWSEGLETGSRQTSYGIHEIHNRRSRDSKIVRLSDLWKKWSDDGNWRLAGWSVVSILSAASVRSWKYTYSYVRIGDSIKSFFTWICNFNWGLFCSKLDMDSHCFSGKNHGTAFNRGSRVKSSKARH